MSTSVDELKKELGALSSRDRAELAHFLLVSLDPEVDEAEKLWDEEASRRVAEIRSGAAKGRPVSELLEELHERLP